MEEVKKTPEKFVEEKILKLQLSEDHLSDTGSWGTDFEDETTEENTLSRTQKVYQSNRGSKSDSKASENKTDIKQEDARTKEITRQEEEGTYANCGPIQNEESMYANYQESETSPAKNTSRLHGQGEKSLAEQLKEQLREQLQLRNNKKPMAVPKPKSLEIRNVDVSGLNQTQPRKSFLHTSKTRSNNPNQTQS